MIFPWCLSRRCLHTKSEVCACSDIDPHHFATNNPTHSSSKLSRCSNAVSEISVTIAMTHMTPPSGSSVPPAKRRRLDTTRVEAEGTGATSTSLSRPVSPPQSRRKSPIPVSTTLTSLLVPAPTWGFNDVPEQTLTSPPSQPPALSEAANQSAAQQIEGSRCEEDGLAGDSTCRVLSPFQLTKIRDLAPHQNVDTVELKDILGNPLIRECWNFNFLFDLDFVM